VLRWYDTRFGWSASEPHRAVLVEGLARPVPGPARRTGGDQPSYWRCGVRQMDRIAV